MWSGTRWEVRDLGSRNGTFVGGRRLEPGRSQPVAKSESVAFGDPSAAWCLVEDGPPAPLATRLGSDVWVPAEGGLLALPSADAPEVVVYRDGRGLWVCERSDEAPIVLSDAQTVEAGGCHWRVSLPSSIEGTSTISWRSGSTGTRS